VVQRRQLVLAAFLISLSVSPLAFADPIRAAASADGSLVADGGAVTVYFAGSEAGFNSQLFVSDNKRQLFFPNHSTEVGESVDLGQFAADTAIGFGLRVSNGYEFFTGAPTLNPDGLAHAQWAAWSPTRAIPVSGVLVSFEDLLGGGDRDFNDLTFVVSGAHLAGAPGLTRPIDAASNPEPASLVLLATGALGIGLKARRARSRRP
jgi:hypothetical protein